MKLSAAWSARECCTNITARSANANKLDRSAHMPVALYSNHMICGMWRAAGILHRQGAATALWCMTLGRGAGETTEIKQFNHWAFPLRQDCSEGAVERWAVPHDMLARRWGTDAPWQRGGEPLTEFQPSLALDHPAGAASRMSTAQVRHRRRLHVVERGELLLRVECIIPRDRVEIVKLICHLQAARQRPWRSDRPGLPSCGLRCRM